MPVLKSIDIYTVTSKT